MFVQRAIDGQSTNAAVEDANGKAVHVRTACGSGRPQLVRTACGTGRTRPGGTASGSGRAQLVRTACGSGRAVLVKLRQLVSLSVKYIVDRTIHATFIPQESATSFIYPRTMLHLPATIL